MCTAISYGASEHYFGRNLDLEYSYKETITITPRLYPFRFRKAESCKEHFAMIGMAFVEEKYPLYYDATNEVGLSMAGLLFANNAYYGVEENDKDNISPFEFIPWILAQCSTVEDAKVLLKRINLVNIDFREDLKLTPLHWLIADKEQSIVVETVKEGLKVYDNPVGVLTNNPPFPYQMMNLKRYRGLSRKEIPCCFAEGLELEQYSRGMGAIGLPGDLSSMSRFVRATFHKMNAQVTLTHKSNEGTNRDKRRQCGFVEEKQEIENVNQFFHLLGSVEMPMGSLELENGALDKTIYSSCCNTARGIYYYTTYENRQIIGVDMKLENLEGCELITYNLEKGMIQIKNA